MHVGKVGMAMPDPLMAMPMRVASARGNARLMHMVVMEVIRVMLMCMLDGFMLMLVLMLFGQVERDTDRHQQHRQAELPAEILAQQADRQRGAHKGRDREVGARSRITQMT